MVVASRLCSGHIACRHQQHNFSTTFGLGILGMCVDRVTPSLRVWKGVRTRQLFPTREGYSICGIDHPVDVNSPEVWLSLTDLPVGSV